MHKIFLRASYFLVFLNLSFTLQAADINIKAPQSYAQSLESLNNKTLYKLLLPGALLCDALEKHFDYRAQDMLSMTLSGYGKRIEQIEPYIQNKNLSPLQITTLALACTAWDSQQSEGQFLIFAHGERLKRSSIINNQAELGKVSAVVLSMFDSLAQASALLKNNRSMNFSSFDSFMNLISAELISPEPSNEHYKIFLSILKSVAQEMQINLKALVSR